MVSDFFSYLAFKLVDVCFMVLLTNALILNIHKNKNLVVVTLKIFFYLYTVGNHTGTIRITNFKKKLYENSFNAASLALL